MPTGETSTLDSTAETERVYQLLSDEGEIFMPIGETFFAHRFAMLRDRFGTSVDAAASQAAGGIDAKPP